MSVQTDQAFVEHPAKPWSEFFLRLMRLFALLGIVATIAGFFGGDHWVADLFAQFRFQWAFGLGVLALLFLVARRWAWFVLCLIGFLVNAYPIWPYFESSVFPKPQEAASETQAHQPGSLRVMSFNVLTRNRRWDDVVKLVKQHDPDFVFFLEVDSTWEQVLTKELGELYPYARFKSRQDNFGIAVMSKHPWDSIEVFDSLALELPSIDMAFNQIEGLGLAKPLRLIGTHPIPPMSESNWNARNEQLFNVAARLDDAMANIIVGDFNLSPWSPNFPRVLEAGNLTDASLRFGPAPTWYVFPSWVGGLKIDHALVNQHVKPLRVAIGPDVGSDHRAVVLDFGLVSESR